MRNPIMGRMRPEAALTPSMSRLGGDAAEPSAPPTGRTEGLGHAADNREPVESDWLEGCTGFIVESNAGRVGRVAEVQRDGDAGRPVALVLHSGIAGWRRLVVPVDDIAGVLPGSDRIILNGSWTPAADEQAAPIPAH